MTLQQRHITIVSNHQKVHHEPQQRRRATSTAQANNINSANGQHQQRKQVTSIAQTNNTNSANGQQKQRQIITAPTHSTQRRCSLPRGYYFLYKAFPPVSLYGHIPMSPLYILFLYFLSLSTILTLPWRKQLPRLQIEKENSRKISSQKFLKKILPKKSFQILVVLTL